MAVNVLLELSGRFCRGGGDSFQVDEKHSFPSTSTIPLILFFEEKTIGRPSDSYSRSGPTHHQANIFLYSLEGLKDQDFKQPSKDKNR